jgi:ornithine cyclodeaminase
MTKTCILVGAPVDSGKLKKGCSEGPAAYRGAGLAQALTALGHRVNDWGDAKPNALASSSHTDRHLHGEAETVAWTAALAEISAKAMASGVPIFLGGDHAMSMGTVSGVAAHAEAQGRPLFVLWLDAHTDIHTPATTDSGNYHGMPVAYIAGRAGFDAFPPFPAPVPARNICLLGIRSVDGPEEDALRAGEFEIADMRVLDERGVVAPLREFLERVRQANGMLHVSLDVDFLDPSIAPGVGTAVAAGVRSSEAHLVMELLYESDLVTSLDLAELNPSLDESGRTTRLMIDLTAGLLGRKSSIVRYAASTRKAPAPSHLALVPFISVENMMRLVHHVGLKRILTELAAEIETDFRRWEHFDKTPRVASHSAVGVIELMPTSDGAFYGFKYVNGHPKNMPAGLQTVTAFGVLADVATGYPLLLSEMTLLTALRTAATSAMAAKHLAPKNAKTMALIGNGAQSEFQALAFQAICGVEDVRLYDIDPAATRKVAANLAASAGLFVTPCKSAEAAIEGAEIITTCTADKQYATILTDNMVGTGVHINAIGGDCPGKTELHRDILLRSNIFVEYAPQTRIEGEIQQLAPDHPVTELWRVIAGQAKGRAGPEQITLFDGVGFAIEDFAALRYVHARVKGTAFVQNLDMIADPDDPRDLYGMLMRAKV